MLSKFIIALCAASICLVVAPASFAAKASSRDRGLSIRSPNVSQKVINQVLEFESREKKISVSQLMNQYAKAREVPQERVDKYINSHAEMRVGTGADQAIRGMFEQMEADRAYNTYINQLLAKYRAKGMVILSNGNLADMNVLSTGPEEAPVHITLFVDYDNPINRHAYEALLAVQEDHKKQLRINYRHYPIRGDILSTTASSAVICAGKQDKGLEYHQGLLKELVIYETDILRLAKQLGLQTSPFNRCIDDQKTADIIDDDITLATEIGIQEAPTLLINGRRLDGIEEESVIREVIETELAKATASR